MPYFFKIVSVFFLATVKFFYTPIYASIIGFEIYETMVVMIAGGISSFLVFYYLSHFVIISTKIIKPIAKSVTPNHIKDGFRAWQQKRSLRKKPKKKFTKRNRLIVKIRRDYGMWTIIFLTPVMLSIPVGAFLLRKYYEDNKYVFVYALIAIAVEGVILCLLFYQIPELYE